MAYCNKCGAYIPDRSDKCIACGTPRNEGEPSEYAYKYDYNETEAKQKETAEERRARKQEENRKWAAEEYNRRQKEKEENEKLKAEAEERRKAQYDPTKKSEAGMSYSEGNSKAFSILSYIGVLFILTYMFLPEDEFAQFHAKQGRRLFLISAVVGLATLIFFRGFFWIPLLLRIGFTLRGIANVKNSEMTELPFINKLFNKLFKK